MSWPRPQSPAVAMMSKSEEKEESCKKNLGGRRDEASGRKFSKVHRGKEGGSGSSSVVVPPTT